MTELHLDEDEWAAILLALKCEKDHAHNEYKKWLDQIIIKIECALPANMEIKKCS